MQSSQTPAIPKAATSHAITQTKAATAMTILRVVGFMQVGCLST
jgi:hypothetical protein